MARGKPDYHDVYRSFDWTSVLRELGWDGAQQSINLGHTIIDRHAGSDQIALYWFGRDGSSATLTYRDLKIMSDKFANLLLSLGVAKGDRIAGVLPRIPETLAIMIGTWKAGGVYVPIFSGFGRDAIAFRIRHCGAKIVCTHDQYRARIPELSGATVVTVAGSSGKTPSSDINFWDAMNRQHIRLDRRAQRCTNLRQFSRRCAAFHEVRRRCQAGRYVLANRRSGLGLGLCLLSRRPRYGRARGQP
jgi:acetyl-CoA synthetase